MRFCPEARVRHTHANTWWGYTRKKFKIGYWKIAVLRRHPDRAVRDAHTPQGLKLEVFLTGLFWPALTLTPVAIALGADANTWLLPLALLLVFFGLTLPFLGRVAKRAPSLLPCTLPFLLCRATGLGLGLAWGLLTRVRLGPPPTNEPKHA